MKEIERERKRLKERERERKLEKERKIERKRGIYKVGGVNKNQFTFIYLLKTVEIMTFQDVASLT